jgi:hypothetical protein
MALSRRLWRLEILSLKGLVTSARAFARRRLAVALFNVTIKGNTFEFLYSIMKDDGIHVIVTVISPVAREILFLSHGSRSC